MMIFDSGLGIDFQKHHLILTHLKRAFGKIRLIDSGIHPLPPESQKEEREAQSISFINAFITKHQIHRNRVSISIPREKVVIRFITFPVATKENLRKVLEYEIPRFTPFEKGETYFDYQLLKEGKDGLRLLVAFVKRAEVDYHLTLLKKVGIQPLSIQIPSVAALNLFFYHDGPKDGIPAILLDFDEPFVELNLLREREWVECLHLPLPQEERAPRIVNLLQRMGLREDSLSKSTFFVYGSGTKETLLASLKATPPIRQVLPPPLHRLSIHKEVTNPSKIYASIGLPLRELTQTQFDLNLLPLEMRKKVKQFGKPLLLILTAIAFVLSVTWGMGIYQQYRNKWNAINAEIKKRKPEIDVVEKLQKQKNELGKEISEFEKIETGEPSKVEIMREMAQILPGTVWIWNLKFTGKEIEISGFADSASDLIPLLDKSPFFEKVEFMAPVTKERMRTVVGTNVVDKEKERFKIKMRLEAKRSTP
jgi:general secretion pathway protein L